MILNENTHVILIASTTGNGGANVSVSSACDLHAYIKTFEKFNIKNIHIISDIDENSKTWLKYKSTFDKYNLYNNIDILGHLVSIPNCSYIITLSGHGYYNNKGGYIIFKNYQISSLILTSYIRKLDQNSEAMIIGDTCHSGSMFQVDTIKHPNINYISACSNTESSVQGCSKSYGYNGGLTSCIIDYLDILIDNKQNNVNINNIVKYCRDILLTVNQHVVNLKSYI